MNVPLRNKTQYVDGVPVVCHTVGRGEPLLFVPPFHADMDRLMPILWYLSKRYLVHMPELPGITNRRIFPNRPHTAESYADMISKLYKDAFPKKRYTMLGLSLGGIIGIRLLQNGFSEPKRFVLYATPVDATYIQPDRLQRIVWSLIQHIYKSAAMTYWLGKYVICNPIAMAPILAGYYLGSPRYWETVRLQVRLSRESHPKAWADIIRQLASLHLPQEGLSFSVSASLVFPKHDNVLNIPKTVRSLKRMFPRSTVLYLPGNLHAPAAPMTEEDVMTMFDPLKTIL